MKEVFWTTKSGSTIPISGMTESHVKNTLRFVCRRLAAKRREDFIAMSFNGEQASLDHEQMFDALVEPEPDGYELHSEWTAADQFVYDFWSDGTEKIETLIHMQAQNTLCQILLQLKST